MINQIQDIFRKKFSSEPIVVRSPGRVNLIGEHTDYNEGFVLPAAIDKFIVVAIGERNDEQINLYSTAFDENITISLSGLKPTNNWASYILGVVDQLLKKGHAVAGFNLVIGGDVPPGAGLSSSAAVECATVFALNELFSLNLDRIDMVRIAQKAEHTYAGVQCGIMDQFASMFGQKNQVIKLDCRSLKFEYKPLQLEDYKIVLFNTNVKHSLASSEYNTRRQQCEQGVSWVKEIFPDVNSLRDVTKEMLDCAVAQHDMVIYKRCKYIVDENNRLLAGCYDLDRGDIAAFGMKMFSTHEGLRVAYEVSCPELDYLVDAVKYDPAVLGARMMGGGFGGCTINLVHKGSIDALTERLSQSYRKNLQQDLTVYVAKTDQGTERVNQHSFAHV